MKTNDATRANGEAVPTPREILEGYREWLSVESNICGMELYPEMGADGRRLVPANTITSHFHTPSDRHWRDAPPSTRAKLVLEIVGALMIPDPIVDAIDAYRAGLADYNENCPQGDNEAANAYAETTYAPPLRVLEAWSHPALSYAGALAALRMALDEIDEMGSGEPMVPALISAALAYFQPKGGAS